MIVENNILNQIPMRTWRWLRVNEARFGLPEDGDRVAYTEDGEKLQDGILPMAQISAEAAQKEALIQGNVSEASAADVSKHANSGYFIEIPAGEKKSEPVVLQYNLAEKTELKDHHFIWVRENSEVTIVLSYFGGDHAYHAGLTRIYAENNAKVHLVKVQLLQETAFHLDAVAIHAEEAAQVDVTAIEFGAEKAVSSLHINLAGAESRAEVESAYFGDGNRQLDLNYVLRQAGRHTDAGMQVRGALLDKSEKIFRGTLDFIKGARGSAGRELEEIVLLSPDVQNRSVPLMLSGEGDVDGHHAVSVGKMNEEKLFYLMSRGLSLREAEKLVIEASFQPALQRIADAALKEQISEYIRRRLANVE